MQVASVTHNLRISTGPSRDTPSPETPETCDPPAAVVGIALTPLVEGGTIAARAPCAGIPLKSQPPPALWSLVAGMDSRSKSQSLVVEAYISAPQFEYGETQSLMSVISRCQD